MLILLVRNFRMLILLMRNYHITCLFYIIDQKLQKLYFYKTNLHFSLIILYNFILFSMRSYAIWSINKT
jgi:hypothetical protein